ncbi:MAG: polysaccharide pyruvyl transferase family protein [Verrucomicrobiia bacterium]
MKIYRHKTPGGNFGDDLNLCLWPQIFPEIEEIHPDVMLLGVGTVLAGSWPGRKVVLGSGLGRGKRVRHDQSWTHYWVRGPLTAKLLGLDADKAISDSAVLWPDMPRPRDDAAGVGLLPHHASFQQFDWQIVAKQCGFTLIDPRQSPASVAGQIATCRKLLTESLHGAIFADVMRIPWACYIGARRFDPFKWDDWKASLQITGEALVLDRPLSSSAPSISVRAKAVTATLATRLGMADRHRSLVPRHASTTQDVRAFCDQLVRYGSDESSFRLSDAKALDRSLQRMGEKLEQFAKDFGLRLSR